MNINLNLGLNLKVTDNGHFNQTIGHIYILIYLHSYIFICITFFRVSNINFFTQLSL